MNWRFNPLPVVRADLLRNAALACLTVALVAVSVASGIAVIAQERALRQGSARAADDFDLLVGANGSATQLVLTAVYLRTQAVPLLDGDILAQASTTPGVRYAAPLAFGDNWQGHPIVGTSADFASRGGSTPPSHGRLFLRRGEAVVGANVSLPLGATFSPAHRAHHADVADAEEAGENDAHRTHRYTVVGRLPARHNVWDTAILVPVEDVWDVHGLLPGAGEAAAPIGPPWNSAHLPPVPAIAIKPVSVADAYRLRGLFRTPRSMALFPAEVLNDLYLALGNVRDLMSALALTTQVLVLAAVLMALLVGFLARQRQFAVLRALGASRLYVFSVVWLEVVLLVAAGAVCGIALGWLASWGLSQWLQTQLGFALPVQLGAAEATLVAGMLLSGAVVGVVPAWLVYRRPIAQGLNAP